MSRRDVFLVASTAAISSLLTYLSCTMQTAPRESSRPELTAFSLSHVPPANDVGGTALSVESRETRVDVATSSQQGPPLRSDTDNSANTASQNPALAFQQQQDLGKTFSTLLSDESDRKPGALNAKIESRFYQEDWNPEWAVSKERNIRALFEASESLGGVVPLEVTCRSKNCQVVVPSSNEQQVRQLSEKFMQAAATADVGMKQKVVSFFPDVSAGRVVFYLSDNGNTDLFR